MPPKKPPSKKSPSKKRKTPSPAAIKKQKAKEEDRKTRLAWDKVKPATYAERKNVKDKCKTPRAVQKCFPGGFPRYPICGKGTCEIDENGVKRAKQEAKAELKRKRSPKAVKTAKQVLEALKGL